MLLSEISRSMAWKTKKLASRTFIHDPQHKRSVLSIKDKNEDADDIVFQMICRSVVSRLNVVLLNQSVLLSLIFIFRLSGLFRVVPTSPDNRSSTVYIYIYNFFSCPTCLSCIVFCSFTCNSYGKSSGRLMQGKVSLPASTITK